MKSKISFFDDDENDEKLKKEVKQKLVDEIRLKRLQKEIREKNASTST